MVPGDSPEAANDIDTILRLASNFLNRIHFLEVAVKVEVEIPLN